MEPVHIEPFFAALAAANPEPETELEYKSDFELLCAVLLSAQATDVSVNRATRTLFAAASTPAQMLALGLQGVQAHIQSIGLYRSKARQQAPLHLEGRAPRRQAAAVGEPKHCLLYTSPSPRD